ncbi:MAG TPA: SMP-30/gluconolactonase/LRE family protein [Roseomonas sp.]|jgi:gluconolactonase
MDGFEIHDDRFRAMVLPNAPLELLGDGYRWLEGPVWFADHDCLYVSDLPNDRILRWSEAAGVTVFRQPAGFANGHARDRQGRLLGCSHRHRHVCRTEPDGSVTILASHWQGKRLNAPNDIVCRACDGTIWFTDPHYGINTDYEGGKQTPELPPRLYRLDPADGALTIAADDFDGPNGLAFSPDERILYVSETGTQFVPAPRQYIRRFMVGEDGQLSGGTVFHKVAPGNADGMRIDELGNLWTGAADGVHCISPDGTLLGKILAPAPVANLAFGGRCRSRLFLCASQRLMAIYTNIRGAVRP